MIKTWRWFGKNDLVTLDMLKQIGVEGIVTSLHHIPNGEIWSLDEIQSLKSYIESYGLKWSVVESLPVSESIKYGGQDRDSLIENYKLSLINLAKAGLNKRLKGNVSVEYQDRLNDELRVIIKMGFTSYFLIVYDFVLYAKQGSKILCFGNTCRGYGR